MKKFQYDTLKSLKACTYARLQCKVGVSVSEPFEHAGLGGQYVEVYSETPRVGTRAFLNVVPLSDWETTAARHRMEVIAELETLVGELQEHLARLQGEQAASQNGKSPVSKEASPVPEPKPRFLYLGHKPVCGCLAAVALYHFERRAQTATEVAVMIRRGLLVSVVSSEAFENFDPAPVCPHGEVVEEGAQQPALFTQKEVA